MYAGTCTDSTLRTLAAMSSSKKGFKLPGFLQLKQTPNRGRGVFTTKRFRCGEEVLTCKPYAIGVSATTAAGLRQLCHQCLKTIPSSRSAIVCDHCQLVAYCCKPCQDEALPVHRVECEGLAKLELDRGKVVARPFTECTQDYWPPSVLLLTTRAWNRKILEWQSFDEWEIASLSQPEKMPPLKDAGFKIFLPYMWQLVVKSVTTEEMLYNAFCKIVINCSAVLVEPSGLDVSAVYTDFSLLNHCCVPNCCNKSENGVMMVYALRDIEEGEELCISYIGDVHRLLPGKFRREKLVEVFGFECECHVCINEKVVGSKSWLLEQQKKRFIAPWSRETAELAMQDGRNALMKLRALQEDKDWAKIADIGEAALRTHKGVLSVKNVIQYLLSKALLEAYLKLDQPANALQFADVVLKSVEEYESSEVIQEVMSEIGLCHFKLGNVEKGKLFTERSLKQFPVKLTPQQLGESLQEAFKAQGVPVMMGTSVEEVCQRFQLPMSAIRSVEIDTSQFLV